MRTAAAPQVRSRERLRLSARIVVSLTSVLGRCGASSGVLRRHRSLMRLLVSGGDMERGGGSRLDEAQADHQSDQDGGGGAGHVPVQVLEAAHGHLLGRYLLGFGALSGRERHQPPPLVIYITRTLLKCQAISPNQFEGLRGRLERPLARPWRVPAAEPFEGAGGPLQRQGAGGAGGARSAVRLNAEPRERAAR